MARIPDVLVYKFEENITACSIATTTPTVSAGFTSGQYVVTPVADKSGAFKVIAWDASSGLARIGDAANGSSSIRNVAIAGLDANQVATASVDKAGALKVDVWVVGVQEFAGSGPQVWFQNGTAGGTATRVSIDALWGVGSKGIVTAVRDGSGNLRVDAWNVAPGLGAGGTGAGLVTANGSSTAGPISDVAVAAVSSNQVVTALRNGSGNLELIVWSVAAGKVVRQGKFEAGPVSQVAITAGGEVDLHGAPVTTAAVNGKGNLELILWTVTPSGSISRGTTLTGGAVTQVDVCYPSLSIGFSAITAARDQYGPLDLAAWNYDDEGKVVTRQVLTLGIKSVAVAWQGFDSAENTYFATAVQNDDNIKNEMEVAIRVIRP